MSYQQFLAFCMDTFGIFVCFTWKEVTTGSESWPKYFFWQEIIGLVQVLSLRPGRKVTFLIDFFNLNLLVYFN